MFSFLCKWTWICAISTFPPSWKDVHISTKASLKSTQPAFIRPFFFLFFLFLSSFLLHFCCLLWFSNLFSFLYSALAVKNSLAIISHPLKINEHSLWWRRSTLLSSTTSFADFEWKQQWTTLVLSSTLHPRPTRVAWKASVQPIEWLKPRHLDCYSPSPQV